MQTKNLTLFFALSLVSTGNCFAASADTDALVDAGRERFVADCGFCHGRDAQGGSRGLDLTRSELVANDVNGNLITEVLRNGRLDKGMPVFATLGNDDISALAAFVHSQKALAESAVGGRRSVEPEDIAVGSATAGKNYFAANCAGCHTANGDLAGVATRFEGLALLRRMLYPSPSTRTTSVAVTDNSGKKFSGALSYRDEFTVALTTADGSYLSWASNQITYTLDDPLQAHVKQLPRYTDEDMHNVLAYLLTLR